MFNQEIIEILKNLKNNFGACALKASFEDEGVTNEDLVDLILLSGKADIPVMVKIGGCEANSDIERCLRHGVSGLVAPMVESSFAVSKFLDSVKVRTADNSLKLFVNFETAAACESSKQILDTHGKKLSGIVVGRSDLSKSMGLTKKNVDDDIVINIVSSTLKEAKNHGLTTTMGGTISTKSVENIKRLFNNGLLDKFETRAVVFDLHRVNLERIELAISTSLKYEQQLLKARMLFHEKKADFFRDRVRSIEERK